MATPQHSLAIVLRWRSYGESDKIVTFLTQDCGKLTGIAKGAKRSRRRFANSLEPLARVRVYFRRRPQATLAFVESCDLLSSPGSLVEPLRFAYGSYLIELTDQLTVEDHPVRELYALLEEGLAALEARPATSAFLRGFELQLLVRAGYAPPLDRCSQCQRALLATGSAFFHINHGTFRCSGCRGQEDALVPVTDGVLPQLNSLTNLPLVECQQHSLGRTGAGAAQLTSRLLALHLTRPLRSVKLIDQLTGGAATQEG